MIKSSLLQQQLLSQSVCVCLQAAKSSKLLCVLVKAGINKSVRTCARFLRFAAFFHSHLFDATWSKKMKNVGVSCFSTNQKLI